VKVLKRFDRGRSRIRILDYGGGRLFSQRLRTASFAHVTTYDPSTRKFCARPEMQFDLITSFETFEHLLDPLSPNGVVPFSTLVQPPALKAAA
jgi:hypothetical protein